MTDSINSPINRLQATSAESSFDAQGSDLSSPLPNDGAGASTPEVSVAQAEFLDHYQRFVGEQFETRSPWRSPNQFHPPQLDRGANEGAKLPSASAKPVKSAVRLRLWFIALFFVAQTRFSWFKRLLKSFFE